MKYYLVVRKSDFEPFIVCKDGLGTSALDCNGYQTFYENIPLDYFMLAPGIELLLEWEE